MGHSGVFLTASPRSALVPPEPALVPPEPATPTLSGPEQASQWANRGNEYTKMKLESRSIILDGSQEPVIVSSAGLCS